MATAEFPGLATHDPAHTASEPEPMVADEPATQARRSFLQRSTRRLLIALAAIFFLKIFVGEASMVPTSSMEGTILVGDHLFMSKLLYGPEIPLLHWRLPMLKTIHRGEIVVFRYPKDPSQTFLKRVAAVGGDTIEIRDGILYVNSRAVNEPYAVHRGPRSSAHEEMREITVPAGELFVIGEPLFVYWSYDAPSSSWLDESFGHQVEFYGSIVGNFFSRTRWRRTGTLL